MEDLSPYMEGNYLVDLRANLLQQGDNDADPSMQQRLGLQINQESPSLDAKVQELIQALQGPKSEPPWLKAMPKSSFVPHIS